MKASPQYLFCIILLVLVSVVHSGCQNNNHNTTQQTTDTIATPSPIPTEFGLDTTQFIREILYLKSGENLGDLFKRIGVDHKVSCALNSLHDSVFNVRKIKAGNKISVFYTQDSLSYPAHIVYHHSLSEHTVFHTIDSLMVEPFNKPIVCKRQVAKATIQSSLWNTMTENHLDPNLALDLSDIYAWTIDFFGIQKGDDFTIYYEAQYVDSTYVGIGNIYAALFVHDNKNYYAYSFNKDTVHGYWDENGNSLRKAFLKAPLHFKRISSHFTYHRKHPIYKTVRPHTGVDYAAPAGTPVMALGDGKVIEKGYKGGGGHTVKIRHNSVYTTAYLHLSKYGKGITPGARVQQGQIIGYVGSTGASTGPHLDFRVWKNGHPINPLQMESPSTAPIPTSMMDEFVQIRDSFSVFLR